MAEQLNEQLSAGDLTLEVPVPPIISSHDIPKVLNEEHSVGTIGKPKLFPTEAQEAAVLK